MNDLIKPTDDQYKKFVKIFDAKNYIIDTHDLQEDQGIVCPLDKDMIVGKTGNDVILVKKRFWNFSPFKICK